MRYSVMKNFRTLAFALISALFGTPSAHAEDARSIVPLTLTQSDYGGGRLYVPMRFGNFLGTMRLDTGASTTRLKLAPWNKDFASQSQSNSTGASGKITRCDDVLAQNVALKATQGNDVARAKYLVARCAANDGDDLLGLDFFKGARVTLDFAHRELVFSTEPLKDGATPFRLLGLERRLVGVDLKIGGAASVGLFDTGAEICAVDLAFLKRRRGLFAPVKGKTSASEAGGKKIAARLFKIKTLDLGEGRVVHDVYALAYDFGALRQALGPETQIILGMNLLNRFTWELDFRAPDKPMWEAKPRQ